MKPWYSLLIGLFLSSAIAVRVKAQITVDGTTNTNLTPTDNGVRIDNGNRAEGNLFHSFSEFSVLKGTEAFFNNPNDIINIFSRVTGGNISNIDGLIRANGKANLFLINPAGIIFGEDASLDIGGSFLGSTANSIVFADGEFLATDGDNTPLLTINMPIGLNLGNNPGQIINRSVANDGNGLEVVPGENIILIGGNINLEGGRIFAGGGRVELGGLSAGGEIGINTDGSLNFPEGIARADVNLTNAAEVDVRAVGGGSISINGHNIELSAGELGKSNLFAGIAPESNSPEAQAGDITLNATDTITVRQGSSIRNWVEKLGVGNAGRIDITTANLFLIQGGFVSAITKGKGNAGGITIEASGTISADGEDQDGVSSGIFSQGQGVGDSGGINITTTNLYMTQGGRIDASNFGEGNAGGITIKASGTIFANGEDQDENFTGIFSQIQGVGNSEGIDITTANLYLTQGGVLGTSTFGRGNAGAITIKASGTISAEGEDRGGNPSGIFSQVEESGVGNSGGIKIVTNNLSLTNKAGMSVESLGQGNPRDLDIQANSLDLSRGASLLGSTPVGKGGNINLQIAQDLTLRDNSTISAQALENANGGNIDINAGFVVAFPNQNNDIIARAAQGNGGEINITTQGIFGIEERSSNPPNNTNDLDASSEFGLNGTIAIEQLDVNPAEALEELPTSVIDVTGLVAQNLCQQFKGSEFIVTGKGGIAPNPTHVRDGEISEVDLVEPVPFLEDKGDGEDRGDGEDGEDGEKIVEAQGWIINDRGNIELVAYSTDVNGYSTQLKDSRVCQK